MKMRTHCRKMATLIEHHESRASAAESRLSAYQQQRKNQATQEYVEYIRVPRRGDSH